MTCFEANVNDPENRVLGLRMHPLTLGHLFLLDRVGSPMIRGGEINIGDLLLAVFVCAHKTAGEAEEALKAWWRNWFFWLWGKWRGAHKIGDEYKRWKEYFDEQCAEPLLKRNLADNHKHKDTSSGSPPHYQLAALAMSELAMTFQECKAMPIAQIKSLLISLYESRGQVRLWTEEDEKLYQWGSKMAEQMTEEKANG